jgi:ABC-2 type transport system ATP-binding protein
MQDECVKEVIEVERLTRKFGRFIANNELTFSVYSGEIFGLLGANGAGKTTVIRILCGLLKPTSGKAFVGGHDVYTKTDRIKKNIGYMSQKFSLYPDLTVYENFRFYGGVYGMSLNEIKSRARELLEQFRLRDYRDSLISKLPQGIRQRLSFAVSIIHNPEIVFLDEPTSGVDPIVRRQFWEMIYLEADRGTTVFVTTHYMDEAEYCKRLCIMSEGRIEAIGTPAELKMTFSVESIEDAFLKIARSDPGEHLLKLHKIEDHAIK